MLNVHLYEAGNSMILLSLMSCFFFSLVTRLGGSQIAGLMTPGSGERMPFIEINAKKDAYSKSGRQHVFDLSASRINFQLMFLFREVKIILRRWHAKFPHDT